ncbi:MAG TPA: hypothetical protein VFL85_04775 [Candidatus Saccharimonadales bacterium]|nr:hypothetical protein [Candidatus Saccharimonadales bacterium]
MTPPPSDTEQPCGSEQAMSFIAIALTASVMAVLVLVCAGFYAATVMPGATFVAATCAFYRNKHTLKRIPVRNNDPTDSPKEELT